MEFDSPDVERDFPGLYASESAKKNNESDFSDESHDKLSRKDLLIGKRKDKKEKKDRGYATLEGESSPEEDTEMKSPSKVKKSKPFKFSSKKEKREKSREKEVKDKDSDKEKKKSDDKDKDKKKETKTKLKIKERKKHKHNEDIIDIAEDLPIFGVPLSVAVERSKCHDGVDIPLVIRNCIDYVQLNGLLAENVYKVSGIKSRVQHVRKMYNNHEVVNETDFDLPIATSLIKQFLRELPEPVLTTDLLPKFEEVTNNKDTISIRLNLLSELIEQLPSCNRALLGWLLKHLDSVVKHEKQNKMNVQTLSTVLSPLMQTSQRLFTILLSHANDLFQNVTLHKYIPPITSVSPGLPDSSESIEEELLKQESLLSQLHKEMNQGLVTKRREEQLWGVQRIITQLKRKLRALERINGQPSFEDSLDNTSIRTTEETGLNSLELSFNKKLSSTESSPIVSIVRLLSVIPATTTATATATSTVVDGVGPNLNFTQKVPTAESLEVQDINRESTEKVEKIQKALFETEELMNVINELKVKCEQERDLMRKIKDSIHNLGGITDGWSISFESSEDEGTEPTGDQLTLWKRKLEAKEETKRLQLQKKCLIESISAECDACIDLKVRIKLLTLTTVDN